MYFPYIFPALFGQEDAESSLSVLISRTGQVGRNAGGAASLAASATTTGSAVKNVSASALLGVVASTGLLTSSANREASASFGVVSGLSVTSQELGVASAEFGATASASGTIDRFRECFAALEVSASTTGESNRLATASTSLSAVGAPTAGIITSIKTETLVERFNSPDGATWIWVDNGATGIDPPAAVVNGVLSIIPTASQSFIYTKRNRLSGIGVFTLNGSSMTARLVSPPTASPAVYARFEWVSDISITGSQASIRFDWSNGNLLMYQTDAAGAYGTSVSVSASVAGSWVRLRLADGVAHWDTSVDGVVWNTQRSQAVISFGYNAGSIRFGARNHGGIADPGVAVFDDLNNAPNQIQSSLNVVAGLDTVGVRGHIVGSSLSALADTSGIPRYDARADSSLALDSYLIAEVMKRLNGAATLSSVAQTSVQATEFGTGNANIDVTAEISSAMVCNYASSSSGLAATFSSNSFVSHGQNIESDQAEVFSESFAGAAAVRRPGSSLAVFATPSAAVMRTANVTGSLAASAMAPGEIFEFSVAQVVPVAISATRSAAVSMGQQLAGPTSAQFLMGSSASLRRNISATLASTAATWATAEEPFSVTEVPVDVRIASVDQSDRGTQVREDSRSVSVEAASTNISIT